MATDQSDRASVHRDSDHSGMIPKVVHCRRERYDVLIDRSTKWGNPFMIGRDGTRAEVIALYEKWLNEQRRDLLHAAQRELTGKVLGCWCAPQPCHGDVLLKIANPEREIAE